MRISGRWLGAAAALLLALGALWYFASPAWTLHRMEVAVKADDADALTAMIDFPALREDMKAELMARMMAEANRDRSGLAGLGVAFGTAFIGPMVDGLVSPAGIRAAFLSRRDGAAAPATRAPQADKLRLPEKPVIVRRGLSEFLLASETDRRSGLVFRREGLSWKLAGIDLPPEPAAAGTP